ncbi:MAG: class I adenylate-forming enzyme family protein [Acidimicrobiia bacterium]
MTEALPIDTSWWHVIDARARLTPDLPFVSDQQGRVLTFGRYRELAEDVAAGLVELGVRQDHVVSWQLPSNLEATILMAALCRLGVRQNPIIPILRRAEVGLITEQVGSRWLVVPGVYRGFDFVEMAKEAIGDRDCTIVTTSDYAGDAELSLPRGDPSGLPLAVDPGDEVRWYYYSSGTTATAKGAKHTDSSVMASSNAQIAYIGLRQDDVFPVPFPITHIGGIMLLTAYLRVGAQLLFLETFDPVTSPELMAERGATVLGSATPFFQAYLAAQRRHGDAPLFPKLRQLQAGGAPITPELNAECLRVFGTPIYNQWGLTEFPAATSLGEGDPPEKFNGTVGRMAPGAEAKTVGFDGETTPPGSEGELWVRGPQRCKGYVDASLDAAAFDAEGYFRTGDLGVIDEDGFVRITGRLKDIIIRNAENLSAQEIEDVLTEHPAIADVAVIGVPDEMTGERACAVIVLAQGYESLTIPELAEHCQAKGLAKQKIPEQLTIVAELPRNPMGKVLKHVLRAQAATKA